MLADPYCTLVAVVWLIYKYLLDLQPSELEMRDPKVYSHYLPT